MDINDYNIIRKLSKKNKNWKRLKKLINKQEHNFSIERQKEIDNLLFENKWQYILDIGDFDFLLEKNIPYVYDLIDCACDYNDKEAQQEIIKYYEMFGGKYD